MLCDICGEQKDDTRYFCGFSACGDCFLKETGGDITDDEVYTADSSRAIMRRAYAKVEANGEET